MNFNPDSFVTVQNVHHPYHQRERHHIPLPANYGSQSEVAVGIEIAIGSGGARRSSGGGSSSPKIMEWTNDDALELIEQYRCHTELWNRADPKYKDKLCRFRAWSEIADRFGCSKAEVERKMNVLLTQYRREKHKMFVKIYQGIQPNPSKWYAFKRFDFMEAGGGSLSGLPTSATVGGIATNSTSSNSASHTHNGLNGLAAAAVAAAAYDSSTIAAAANGGATGPIGCAGGAATTTTGAPASQHRRIKTKELKYFGAMGLNIPMLIASSQTQLDNWNTAGQYSPPIGSAGGGAGGLTNSQPQQLRVALPMSYGAASGTPYTVGGGSSSSEFKPSPHKTVDTSDNEDNAMRDEATVTATATATASALGQLAAKVERRSPVSSSMGAGRGSEDGGLGNAHGASESSGCDQALVAVALSEAGSSPIPNTNTNMHEAHKNHLLQSSPASARAATPRHAHEQLHHGHHALQHHGHGQHPDELDIKQELVDYFHPPSVSAAPAPPDSHRSYSSAGEESRLHLDMAQDLRVAQAKAHANFGSFVLPPRSSSAQLAAAAAAASMPLNMRKLTAASSAGHMLMSSLLSSRESMSDADGDVDNDEATESAASPGHIKSSVSAQDAGSAAAAAAALYAESLSRDDCDFVGSNVSMKLRTMDRTQRIIAEKLISEVLFFGQFNELERSACIQPK
ncbi:pneumococcal serine-rich repeat protein isoform X1 [Drosophila virilis]|uniref:Uncharacterized protein, isoform A n=2 Tax=Drosophila virilis TaxID=7244 RepID=B4LVL3_DROVI|nr:pneumococcal serine-rich repeat protein isoform X1 [Drosophila virilis]XP_015028386.1 pneumococcal serine-rich repeat protein isoform X1 [Drosophila virilis]XP_015028387.1 pneumococcal serine-rich repeat protein isoform X1 [Drosophila virilis]XP_015028390.1 pneumococcal serine-rich repeat protein isoform X1 [Drosophila virilis]EDW64407.1 uncharacterized protein Dvir_GJ17452, isoform A [Drosophila virilis]KRF81604.1 uncharacterized protein Dvir_GJ17452, isoform B [Drosophila virilis]KRF8160